MVAPGEWEVIARVERFVEPALLLALHEGRSHGYELAERLADVIGVESVDYGNLYRLLRVLEQEGIVSSVWDDDAPGRSKRIYDLTEHGAALLDAWAAAPERIEPHTATRAPAVDPRSPGRLGPRRTSAAPRGTVQIPSR